jgi:hypothetical protein
MVLENCFHCKNLTINKRKNYRCEFKKCNMGKKPYFPVKIPEDAKYWYGFEVCRFEPKWKE